MQVWRAVAAVWLSIGMALSAHAQSEAHHEAERLLVAIDMQKVLDDSLTHTLDVLLRSDPQMQPFRAVFERFFRKHLSFEKLKPELVRMYAETFSAGELRQLTDFYATPVGKKALRTLPQLMNRASDLGMAQVQANREELTRELEEAMRQPQR
jgi:uncharacterized protein